MKKLLFIPLSILIISFLESCKKDPVILPTVVNGQVLEQGSNKPIEGVKVVLMEGAYNGIGSGTYSFYPVDTFLTDKDGKYNYEHKIPFDKKTYELWYFKDKYFDINNISENDRITRIEYNKTKSITTKMFPFAWVSVRLLNLENKYNYIYFTGIIEGSNSDKVFIGKSTNTVFNKKVKGNVKLPLFWNVRDTDKLGIEESFYDTIFVKKLDTLFYQIKY